MSEIYLSNGVSALGPYAEGEISARERGKRVLGWPHRTVWLVRARSLEEARAKAQRAKREEGR
jgi:hypothetical protein